MRYYFFSTHEEECKCNQCCAGREHKHCIWRKGIPEESGDQRGCQVNQTGDEIVNAKGAAAVFFGGDGADVGFGLAFVDSVKYSVEQEQHDDPDLVIYENETDAY
jgi:hypothetical protein